MIYDILNGQILWVCVYFWLFIGWLHRLSVMHVCLEDLETVSAESLQNWDSCFFVLQKQTIKKWSCHPMILHISQCVSYMIFWVRQSCKWLAWLCFDLGWHSRIMGAWKNEATYLNFSFSPFHSPLLVHFIVLQYRFVWFAEVVFCWCKFTFWKQRY